MALHYLKENGAATATAIATYVKDQVASMRTEAVLLSTIPKAIADGEIEQTEDGLKITEHGLIVLEQIDERGRYKRQEVSADLVKANLYTENADKTPYTAPELKHVAWRPGAFDYLECPSVISGKPTPYFIKRKEA